MIPFRDLSDHDTALAHSPLVRALNKTFAYMSEHNGIGLTPSKAFNRKFVHWAAAEFDWPGQSQEDLFQVNKVLNEMDFQPVVYIHALMAALKLGRHYKDKFKLGKNGQSLMGHSGKIFALATPFFLFNMDHSPYRTPEEPLLGNWPIFLNILNIETETGASGQELRKCLYGVPEQPTGYDNKLGQLYIEVLRPLCWAGLLHESQTSRIDRFETRVFTKTPLWRAALRLDTDDLIKPVTRH
eukprot:gene14876-15013_t